MKSYCYPKNKNKSKTLNLSLTSAMQFSTYQPNTENMSHDPSTLPREHKPSHKRGDIIIITRERKGKTEQKKRKSKRDKKKERKKVKGLVWLGSGHRGE